MFFIAIAFDLVVIVAVSLIPLGFMLHFSRRSRWALPASDGDGSERDVEVPPAVSSLSRTIMLASAISLVGVFVTLLLPLFSTTRAWYSYCPAISASLVSLVVLLMKPVSPNKRPAAPHLDYSRRSIWSFGSFWWHFGLISSAVALVAISVAAGVVSTKDEFGNFTRFTIVIGNVSVSTPMFGWFYSVPVLIGAFFLITLATLTLWAVAYPPMAPVGWRRQLDLWLRKTRANAVLALGTGAILTTLGVIARDLARAGRLTAELPTEPLGNIDVVSPFSAIAMPLDIVGICCAAFGVSVALSYVLLPRPHFVDSAILRKRLSATAPTSALGTK